MATLLLKTSEEHVHGVRRNAKHATDAVPRELKPGDLILIQVTYSSTANRTSRVRYKMTYVGCYRDTRGESKTIWGKQWDYIIEGRDLCQLFHPFDIDTVNKSGKNYGRGVIKYAYVDSRDLAEAERRGYLSCA